MSKSESDANKQVCQSGPVFGPYNSWSDLNRAVTCGDAILVLRYRWQEVWRVAQTSERIGQLILVGGAVWLCPIAWWLVQPNTFVERIAIPLAFQAAFTIGWTSTGWIGVGGLISGIVLLAGTMVVCFGQRWGWLGVVGWLVSALSYAGRMHGYRLLRTYAGRSESAFIRLRECGVITDIMAVRKAT